MNLIYQLTFHDKAKPEPTMLFFKTKEAAITYWNFFEENMTPKGRKMVKIEGEEVELLDTEDVLQILNEG